MITQVFKVSEMTYAENWGLVCKIYRWLSGPNESRTALGEAKWQPKAV